MSAETREEHYRRLERMYHAAPCNEYYQPRLSIERGRTRLVIPVRPDFFHAAGAAHGSLYFKAMDDAAFFAVASLVPDVFVLTASLTTHLLRPVAKGEIVALGRVVQPGKQLFLAEAELFNDKNKLIGRAHGNFTRSAMPLSAEMGYK